MFNRLRNRTAMVAATGLAVAASVIGVAGTASANPSGSWTYEVANFKSSPPYGFFRDGAPAWYSNGPAVQRQTTHQFVQIFSVPGSYHYASCWGGAAAHLQGYTCHAVYTTDENGDNVIDMYISKSGHQVDPYTVPASAGDFGLYAAIYS